MTKTQCLIVDDEPVAQRIIEGYLDELDEFVIAGKCLNALQARKFLQHNEVGLLFLDLEMPRLKGYAFLRTLPTPPAVIITTAHREYALEGYELEVLDYLLKPISFERFLQAINRYKKIYHPRGPSPPPHDSHPAFLYVRSDGKTLKLRQADLLFIEGMSNYIRIHCSGHAHIVYSSLQNILEALGPSFVRVHKSFIINKNQVTAFTAEQVEIGETSIPVGGTYRGAVEHF